MIILRQLVLIRQDHVLVNFFTFPKKWVGRAMGNEALNWDGLIKVEKPLQKPCMINLAQRRIQKDRDQSK